MKIEVTRKAYSGDTVIKPGKYLVSMSPESGTILLVGAGGEIRLNAVRRPSKGPIKQPKVHFGPAMGDPFWVLSFLYPPKTEWVAFLRMDKKDAEDED